MVRVFLSLCASTYSCEIKPNQRRHPFGRPTNGTLTWKLKYGHLLYDSRKIREDIQQAFDDWARDTQLSFREVTENEKADFNIAFVSGDRSDGFRFNGPGRQVSRSFRPESRYAGHIHFYSSEKWSHKYYGIGYNLHLAAAHGVGSDLGLSHSNDPDSIMSSSYLLLLLNEMLSKQCNNNLYFSSS
ncbi:unnamed protein product [Rotaria sp. Silwood1]|nr:unnamed protein product [Rotaria sp. Silwood1]